MSTNQEQVQPTEIEKQTHEFYSAVISDLKNQIANLADEKSVQYALNVQNQKACQNLIKLNKELENKIKDLEVKFEKMNNAGPVPKEGGKQNENSDH